MIIFDLDGTLADCEHRRHLVNGRSRGETPQWDEFYRRCVYDEPIIPMVFTCKTMALAHNIEIWSGRSLAVLNETTEWLDKYLRFNGDMPAWNELRMRPVGDTTPDDQLKERWLKEHAAAGKEPIDLVFDDRKKVVDMWRRNGIMCAQVAPGDF